MGVQHLHFVDILLRRIKLHEQRYNLAFQQFQVNIVSLFKNRIKDGYDLIFQADDLIYGGRTTIQ